MVGSFCLFVGNFAVLFDDGSPATCGLFACTSKNVAALAVAIVMSASEHAPRMTAARIDRRNFILVPPMGIEMVDTWRITQVTAMRPSANMYHPSAVAITTRLENDLILNGHGTVIHA